MVAIGGNAIIKEREEGTVPQQFANTRLSVRGVVSLVRAGHRVTLTHGNGPQVGNILIRVQSALGKAYSIPIGVAVAESQGEIGYMIGQSLKNQLVRDGLDRPVAVILTQVVCDADDPALAEPTKPVGPFYAREEADRLEEAGFRVVEDAGRGYRVVVPSPHPRRIVEIDSIETLVRAGTVVIAAGGGGMPVYELEDGALEGIDGVIDKDYASALLADQLGADDVVFLTGTDHVFLDYGEPTQRLIHRIGVREMREHYETGVFPVGSMGPKVGAALQFVEGGGRRALITTAENLERAYVHGDLGTWIESEDPSAD